MNYYNEFDPNAAAWLRELIQDGLIPNGDVDERSITDVTPDDLRPYTQCHFFAGIGGWSLALQLAGWPEDRPVWTGSCPCQPYSTAGKQRGNADERDLWPVFFRLIAECKPEFVFGEQVENAIRHGWLDRVYADLEREAYAVGAAVLGAHSVGAPHRRYRLYWGGVRMAENPDGWGCGGGTDGNQACSPREVQIKGLGWNHGMANNEGERFKKDGGHCHRSEERASVMREFSGMATPYEQGFPGRIPVECPSKVNTRASGMASFSPWRNSRFILCRDGKTRRIPSESLLFGRVDGVSESMDGCRATGISEAEGFPLTTQTEGRAMLLKGYGNAIVPQVAAEFITAFMEVYNDRV